MVADAVDYTVVGIAAFLFQEEIRASLSNGAAVTYRDGRYSSLCPANASG